MKKLAVEVIAEIGVNHNGSIRKAEKLIKLAKKAGFNFVKFQTFKTDDIVRKNTSLLSYQKNYKFDSQYKLLKKLELSEEQHKKIIKYCKFQKIKFLSTPFDIDSCRFLRKIGLKIIKISSGDINNYPLLLEVSKFAKKVILSTGMSTLVEIKNAIKILKKNKLKDKNIKILHCTSSYPVQSRDANLLAISYLKKKLKNDIGFSDHTLGKEAAVAAVALGAVIIEKHITLNKKLFGPDHKASLEPKEFFDFIKSIRIAKQLLGIEKKFITSIEKNNKKLIRRSIVAKSFIKEGDKFTENNIICKRPEGGMSPIYWNKILGKIAKKNYQIDQFIK